MLTRRESRKRSLEAMRGLSVVSHVKEPSADAVAPVMRAIFGSHLGHEANDPALQCWKRIKTQIDRHFDGLGSAQRVEFFQESWMRALLQSYPAIHVQLQNDLCWDLNRLRDRHITNVILEHNAFPPWCSTRKGEWGCLAIHVPVKSRAGSSKNRHICYTGVDMVDFSYWGWQNKYCRITVESDDPALRKCCQKDCHAKKGDQMGFQSLRGVVEHICCREPNRYSGGHCSGVTVAIHNIRPWPGPFDPVTCCSDPSQSFNIETGRWPGEYVDGITRVAASEVAHDITVADEADELLRGSVDYDSFELVRQYMYWHCVS
jgi:hypothetical protein